MGKIVKGDFTHALLRCPFCGANKSNSSHRTACYKVKKTSTGFLSFKCVACCKTFRVETKGDFIFKKDNLQQVIE